MSENISEEIESPFVQNEEKKLTRQEYKDKYSVRQLAELAEPIHPTLSFNSLKGRSKDFNIDIILGINQEEIQNTSSKASHKASTNESQELVNVALGLLNAFKQQREGQNSELNPIAREMFKSTAENQVDKARADGLLQTDKFNTLILAVSGTALIIDGVIGFKNVPGLFEKIRSKMKKKAAANNDTK